MQKGIDLDVFSAKLRKKAIDVEEEKLLITNFRGTDQAKDASTVNCGGFGRIRTLSQRPRPNWVNSCVRYRVSAARLGLSDAESEHCQVFQNAARCNFRCWFCFVDYMLLDGDIRNAAYLSVDELLDRFLAENFRPRIIALSGGQPDLIPEWGLVVHQEPPLRRGLDEDYYVWVDDNLSTYFVWEFLSRDDWEVLREYQFLGRLCGVKSFSRKRFSENTGVRPEFFDRQIDVLSKLVSEGMDVYIELVLATNSLDNVSRDIPCFMGLLQNKVHHNIPLRMNPCEIRPYTPMKKRLTPGRQAALRNQYRVLEIWLEELDRRFSSSDLSTPQHLVRLD